MVSKCFPLAGLALRISSRITIVTQHYGLHQELDLENGCLFRLATVLQ